jgi:hypothetical protein
MGHYPRKEMEGHVVKNTKDVFFFNYLHDERSYPDCEASNSTVRRLCPCAAKKDE